MLCFFSFVISLIICPLISEKVWSELYLMMAYPILLIVFKIIFHEMIDSLFYKHALIMVGSYWVPAGILIPIDIPSIHQIRLLGLCPRCTYLYSIYNIPIMVS